MFQPSEEIQSSGAAQEEAVSVNYVPSNQAPVTSARSNGGAPTSSTIQALDLPFAHDWLDWQCRMISGVVSGAVVTASAEGDRALAVAAGWPERDFTSKEIVKAAARAMLQNAASLQVGEPVQEHPGDKGPCDVLAVPLRFKGEIRGAVVVIMATRSDAQQKAVTRLLDWGSVWLERRMFKPGGPNADYSFQFTRRLLDSMATLDTCQLAALVVNELADNLNCSRVSMGLGTPGRVHLVAMSHQQDFDHRTRLVLDLEEVMDDTTEFNQEVFLPTAGQPEAAPNWLQRTFGARYGSRRIASLPLRSAGQCIGCMVLEWGNEGTLDGATRDTCNRLAQVTGMVVGQVASREIPIVQVMRERLGAGLRRTLGLQHWKFKLALVLILALFSVLQMIDSEFHVTARAEIEGGVQQVLVAPRAGHLIRADVRAGDRVEAGQSMGQLDTREIELEINKWRSIREKHRQEQREALANHDRTGTAISEARVAEAQAQIDLLEGRRRRSELRAPFEGLVVSGDRSQLIGSPVEVGEVLFTLASAGDFKIRLDVDERDIEFINPGQAGSLRLTSSPGRSLPLQVQRVVPVARSESGGNYFRVEARLTGEYQELRPGMAGVAKLNSGSQSLLWILTHELRQRLALWLWSIGAW